MEASMNVVCWVGQVVLAALFGMSGLSKVVQPKEKLAGSYPWMQTFSQGTVRFIGVMEILGAIGLIVPAATGVDPGLTPVAATGLAVMMLLAASLHLHRRELAAVAFTTLLLVPTALIAAARFATYS
jgi:uncharacterized membrane protein